MLRLFLVCTLAVTAFADVSHVLRRPFTPTPFKTYPVVPQPIAPIPYSHGRQIGILRQTQDIQPDGSYQYSYDTENGISAEERAQEHVVGNELEKSAQGSFSWTSPEGERVSVAYLADGNGYQPQGSHLPVAPPIPPAIQRALNWLATQPQTADDDGRSVYIGQRRY